MGTNDQEVALVEFARRLVPDDPALLEEVRLAVRDRVSFQERFSERIERRMWTPVDSFEPWIFGLVDGLLDRQRVGGIDWKSGPDEIIAAVDVDQSPLPRDPQRWAWLREPQTEWLPTAQLLQRVAEHLALEGWILGQLDTDSDEYTLVVLRAQEAQELQALSSRAVSGRIRGLLLPPCDAW
jgi:hypothetical protein